MEARAALSARRDEVLDFVARANGDPTRQCLYLDTTAEGIRAQVEDLDQPFEELFQVVEVDGVLVAVAGMEAEAEVDRAWLFGPYAADEAWDARAEAVLRAVCRRVPRRIPRLSAFLNERNERALALLERFGFRRTDVNHVYHAVSRELPDPAGDGVRPYGPAWREAIERLHDEAFPGTWMSPAEMVESHENGTGALFVAVVDGAFCGYVFVKEDLPGTEGSVEFLAVPPGRRRKGLGEALLLEGLRWLFGEKGLGSAHLCVAGGNVNARSLYERLGFVLEHSGVALDLDLREFRKVHRV